MYIVYFDDANDREGQVGVFAGLAIPSWAWKESYTHLRQVRRDLRDTYGVHLRKEIHGRDLVAGRGKIATKDIPKAMRRQIYLELLDAIAELPQARLFCAEHAMKKDGWAFERLCNRINVEVKKRDTHAIVFCDKGKDSRYRKIARRLAVYNPIPWGGGYKSIPTERIIEDPHFLDSAQSLFIQMADICAYALLRYTFPNGPLKKHGLEMEFERLESICAKESNRNHPLGIVSVRP